MTSEINIVRNEEGELARELVIESRSDVPQVPPSRQLRNDDIETPNLAFWGGAFANGIRIKPENIEK